MSQSQLSTYEAYQKAFAKAQSNHEFNAEDFWDHSGRGGLRRDFTEEERAAVNIAIQDAKEGRQNQIIGKSLDDMLVNLVGDFTLIHRGAGRIYGLDLGADTPQPYLPNCR